jgi:hypothetical protein
VGSRKLGQRLAWHSALCQGWGADPALVRDEERDLFRFTDGRFAFSREHADWALLRKRGRLRGVIRLSRETRVFRPPCDATPQPPSGWS